MSVAIIYHEIKPGIPCPDGIAAAWVAKKKYPNAVSIGASYGCEVPDTTSFDRVLIVDFSFPIDVLNKMAQSSEVTVIDHHKTAMQDLSQFEGAIFDTKESGATLTWNTLFPYSTMPAFLEYVKDRDLWNFELPFSEEIHEAMSFIGRDFYKLDRLAEMSAVELQLALTLLGSKLLEPKRSRIAELVATAQPSTLFGCEIMLVDIPQADLRLISDTCSAIYKSNPDRDFVVAQYFDENEQVWNLSFRSDKNGSNFDVSEIARQFCGGGHRNAAGGKSGVKLLALA